MKTRHWTIVVCLAGTSMIGSLALAQDNAEPAVDSAQEEASERPKLNELTIGATSFSGDSVLNQYASPIEGFGIYSLRMLFSQGDGSPFLRFAYRGMPNQDNYASLLWQNAGGRTMVRAERFDYSHYNFAWQPKSESIDKAISLTLDQAIAPGVGGFAYYKSDKREANYPAPRTADLTQTQTLGGGVGGSVLGGNGKVNVIERRTYTDTGAQPTTMQRTVSASFSRDLSETLNVGGTAQFARIEQTGQQGSDVTTLALNGLWDIGAATSMQFHFSDQDIENNIVQNAYVRKRLSSGMRLLHRVPGWTLQLGYRHLETERLRSDQSYVDVPESNTIDFRAAGRFGAARVTVKGSWEDVQTNAVMLSDDPRQLYWDTKTTFQARAEGGGENFVAYGSYTYRNRQNEGRGVEVTWNNFALGGSYVFDPTLSGYAEVSFDDFDAVGGAETNQTLDSYFPNAWNFASGVDWAYDPATFASANINFYESGDVRGAQLTFSVRRTLSPDSDIEILVAPWSRDDRQLDLTGYHTTFLSARYKVRF